MLKVRWSFRKISNFKWREQYEFLIIYVNVILIRRHIWFQFLFDKVFDIQPDLLGDFTSIELYNITNSDI